MLTSFFALYKFWPFEFWPVASQRAMNIRLECSYGGMIFADMLLKDRSVIKKLNPKDGTDHPYILWRQHEAYRRDYFSILESPLDFEVEELHARNMEDYDLAGELMEDEADFIRRGFERADRMKAAMEGNPGELKPSWWKRHVVTRWARLCEKEMFREQLSRGW